MRFEIIHQDNNRIIAIRYIKTSKNTSLGDYIYLYEENKVYKYKLESIKNEL